MNHEKKCKVIMLPTKDNTLIAKVFGTLLYGNRNEAYKPDSPICQHLYILSDDEIKEGDRIYDTTLFEIRQLMKYTHDENPNRDKVIKDCQKFHKEKCKKIIATTDSSLTINIPIIYDGDNPQFETKYSSLSRPSDSFIKKYCEEGGIDEVMVEYEPTKIYEIDEDFGKIFKYNHSIYIPKVAPDNTITIRKVKDSWSREEVIQLCRHAWNDGFYSCKDRVNIEPFEDWAKENL